MFKNKNLIVTKVILRHKKHIRKTCAKRFEDVGRLRPLYLASPMKIKAVASDRTPKSFAQIMITLKAHRVTCTGGRNDWRDPDHA